MNKETNPMAVKPIYPLLAGMALPPCISMLIQSLYNIVDSLYVAKLGENALTAVSLAYPLQNVVLSLGVGLGVAMNSSIARNLGAGNKEEAESSMMHGFLLAACHAVLFVLTGLFLAAPFLNLFTDQMSVLKDSIVYTRIILCFSFWSLFHIAIEKIFQSVGNMVVPMLLQAFGAVVNIILDPIFIFGYLGVPAMGVKGAAIATIIGQMCACVSAIVFFFRGRLPLSFRPRGFRICSAKVRELYSITIPSTIVMAVPSTLVGILNRLLISFSQTAVAVFGVYFKLQSFVYMPSSGIVQGMRPIVSFNYGAGDKDRMKQAIRASLTIVGGILLAGALFFLPMSSRIMGLFSSDPVMVRMGTQALRIICIGFPLSAFAVVYAGALEALGKGPLSLAVTFVRQMLFVPLLAYSLSAFMGLPGVWLAFPLAEFLGAITACIIGKKAVK